VADDLDVRVLAQAPELSSIAALDELLVIVAHALEAEHPTLALDAHEAHRVPPTLREARRLVRDAHALRRRVARYRRAVLDAIGPVSLTETELPF
jgi:hypothetical protein